MRNMCWGAIAKACLFAIVWHVAISFVPRRNDVPWATISLGLASFVFPIIVAVNMGYNAAVRERQKAILKEESIPDPPRPNPPPPSDAITADIDAGRRVRRSD